MQKTLNFFSMSKITTKKPEKRKSDSRRIIMLKNLQETVA